MWATASLDGREFPVREWAKENSQGLLLRYLWTDVQPSLYIDRRDVLYTVLGESGTVACKNSGVDRVVGRGRTARPGKGKGWDLQSW